MPNATLARRVLSHIEQHPETWDQKNFATRSECGTAFCFAGHAVALTYPQAKFMFGAWLDSVATSVDIGDHASELWSVDALASHLLGLDDAEAWEVFDEGNTLDDLRDLVEQLEAPGYVPGSLCSLARARGEFVSVDDF